MRRVHGFTESLIWPIFCDCFIILDAVSLCPSCAPPPCCVCVCVFLLIEGYFKMCALNCCVCARARAVFFAIGCFAFWLFERSFVFVCLPLYGLFCGWLSVSARARARPCLCVYAIGFCANVLCVLLTVLLCRSRRCCSVMSMVFLQPFNRS